MPTHTNDFANAVKSELSKPKGKKGKSQHYHGVDIGQHVDYAAIKKLLMDAVKKLPKGEIPEGVEDFTLSVVIHGDNTGAAWVMDVNPYKTWAW